MTTDNAARQRSTPPQQGRRSGRVWYGTAVLIALVWLAAAGPLGSFMGALTDVQTNDSSAFLPIGAESSEVQEAQQAFRDSGAIPAIVVYSAAEPIARDGLAAISKDAERIGARPWVDGAVAGPIPGTEDQRVAQLIVPVGEQADVRAAVDELRELLADSELPDATVQVAGPAALSSDLGAAFGGIDGALLGVALGAVLIILIAVYRSPLLPFVVIMAAMLALVLAAAVVYLMADAGWIQLNGQSQGILFILVVGACTDYALLLVARYREELYERERPVEAMRIAVRGTIEPILASGGTVILGVLCLLASDLASNRGLGPVAALGIGAALISALTFLPAVLLLLGRAAFWPVKPRQTATTDVSATGTTGDTATGIGTTRGSGTVAGTTDDVVRRNPLWGRIAMAVDRRPRVYWAATIALLAVAAAFVPTFRAEGTSQLDVFRTEVESVQGQRTLERGFGSSGSATPAIIVTDADQLDAVTAAAKSVPGVTEVTPVGDGRRPAGRRAKPRSWTGGHSCTPRSPSPPSPPPRWTSSATCAPRCTPSPTPARWSAGPPRSPWTPSTPPRATCGWSSRWSCWWCCSCSSCCCGPWSPRCCSSPPRCCRSARRWAWARWSSTTCSTCPARIRWCRCSRSCSWSRWASTTTSS